jgi:hypothetical protein
MTMIQFDNKMTMTMTMIVTMTGGSEDKNHAGVLLVSRLA